MHNVRALAIHRARAQPLAAVLVLAIEEQLKRIVSMLTKMAMKFNGVAESKARYHAIDDYEHEHRYAEHEHGESQNKGIKGNGKMPPHLMQGVGCDAKLHNRM